MRRGVRGSEEIELRKSRSLIGERDFLAVAKRSLCAGKRRYFLRTREEADEIRNDALFSDARPEGFYRAGIALMAGKAGISAQTGSGILRVVGVVRISAWSGMM